MNFTKKITLVILATIAANCSSATDADLGNTGAMVAAAFSSSGSTSLNQSIPLQLIKHLVAKARAQTQGGDTNTCDDAEGGPENVTTTLTGTAGTYGSALDAVTITNTSTEFCKTTEGSTNDNTDDLLFASFTVTSATVTCDDASEATLAGSGIWRNRDDLGYYPQIYGSFTITIGGTEGQADCSIALAADGVVASASCSDTAGTAISLSDDITCTIDAGDDGAVPSDPAGENG